METSKIGSGKKGRYQQDHKLISFESFFCLIISLFNGRIKIFVSQALYACCHIIINTVLFYETS